MAIDTLSDVLRVVRLSGGMFLRLDLTAPFSLNAMDVETVRHAFAGNASQVLPFHLVSEGPIWFDVTGADPVLLQTGDIIVIPHGDPHAVYDVPGTEPMNVPDEAVSGSPLTLKWDGDGAKSYVLCGFFNAHGRLFNPLMDSLPTVVVVRNDSGRTPWLVAMMERTFDETLDDRPGGAALVERLTSLLFMEVIQRYLADEGPQGWLAGLGDPVVGKVLQLMHQEPAAPWTVEDLAKRAAASRSVLAERFVAMVGVSPIKYLTSWRMELAAARLLDSNDSLSEIAASVGYESEPAFSRAFKRHVGEPPATWRSAARIGS